MARLLRTTRKVYIVKPIVTLAIPSGSLIKTINELAIVSVKTVNGLANAVIKTFNSLTNI